MASKLKSSRDMSGDEEMNSVNNFATECNFEIKPTPVCFYKLLATTETAAEAAGPNWRRY